MLPKVYRLRYSFTYPLLFLAALLTILVPQEASRQPPENAGNLARDYRPVLAGAERVDFYKTVGDTKLQIWIYPPKDRQPGERRPAIVFFSGGGWLTSSPRQFEKHCEYFAERGLVAMIADYRTAHRHNVKAVDCVKDVKSAIRWIRARAGELGVDPDRIVASAASAGGHIAACTGTVRGLEPAGEDTSVSSKPNAMVLFNPVMALGGTVGALPEALSKDWNQRLGIEPTKVSPYHNLDSTLPPTIMFFGTDDWVLHGAKAFAEKAQQLGRRCELLTWAGEQHGFFNFGRSENNRTFLETVKAADRFLQSLGYLEGPAKVEQFLKVQR